LVEPTQGRGAPLPNGPAGKAGAAAKLSRYAHLYAAQRGLRLLRRGSTRLQRQVARLESTLKKKIEQLRIIDDLVKDLQREISELRGKQPEKSAAASGGTVSSGAG